MCSNGRVPPHSGVRAESGAALASAAGARPRGARAGGGGRAASRAGHRGGRGSRSEAGNAPGGGARHLPSLVLVDRDPVTVEREWEGVLRRLEDTGFAVDPVEQGAVVFETKGVERLYGGVQPALERALAAVGTTWDPRIGAAGRRFTALAAASVARPGQILLVAAKEEEAFLEPLPLSLLPMTPNRYAELEGLGLRSLGELAQLPGSAVAERLGVEGRNAWRLAQGGRTARVRGRKPASELVEALTFPEAIANELTLRRALGSLLERLLARPERAGRPFRKLALVARLVDGGSWRRVATLRDATAEVGRLRSALGPKLQELPAPIVELRLEAVELAEHTGQQLALVEPAGRRTSCAYVKGCARCVRARGRGRCARLWKWLPGRGFPKPEPLSSRKTYD